ncbi:fluoride efflux transporter FluC [Phycicoccus flavus]|uniref:fluoride efflux transporter FluC n=1 Tax=Phycicoccus flavus TaxID=2502783 RepID=UPI000FEBD3E7|nr:CrcB family protein [Phycicoccus flavus]NHA66525.1 CrcB family protein [Phycicoccus flavus]
MTAPVPGPAPGRAPDLGLLGSVALGGAAGSLGRWGVGLALPHGAGQVPWATLLVNVTGAFAMGLLVASLVDRPGAHRLVRPFLGVGVLGGWTTFSALAVETVELGAGRHVQVALLYLTLTFVAGLFAVAAGVRLGRTARPGP